MARSIPAKDRFWAKVKKSKPNDCWVWTGCRHPFGYGMLTLFSPSKHKECAHRISWEIHNGPIPHGLHVLHRCDNPPCVNPDHLFLGTHADNLKDAADKGRMPKGTEHHNAVLSDEDVIMIRRLYSPRIYSTYMLAKQFGVGQSAIFKIISNKNWKAIISA